MGNAEYFRRRGEQEQAAAERSLHPHVRSVHFALAEGYARKLREIDANDRRAGFQLVRAA